MYADGKHAGEDHQGRLFRRRAARKRVVAPAGSPLANRGRPSKQRAMKQATNVDGRILDWQRTADRVAATAVAAVAAEVAMKTPESDEIPIRNERLSSSGRTLDRVNAALRGEFDADELEPDEARLFQDLFGNYMAGPNPERDAFVAKMYAEGGYVGEDGQGRLIRTLRGGGVEIIAKRSG